MMDGSAEDVQGYVAPSLPREIELGGEPLTLRRMTPADADKLHAFFLSLPAGDLLFLRRDPTSGREIGNWIGEVERGETVTIIALSGSTVMGEATLHLSDVPWTRHVGVVRVVTAHAQRGRGLGRLLLEELLHLAPSLGIEQIMAEATVEQSIAHRLLADLGFAEAARLPAFVRDRAGKRHDLVIFIRDVADPELTPLDQLAGRPSPWRCTVCGVLTRVPDVPNQCPDCGAGPGFLLRVDED